MKFCRRRDLNPPPPASQPQWHATHVFLRDTNESSNDCFMGKIWKKEKTPTTELNNFFSKKNRTKSYEILLADKVLCLCWLFPLHMNFLVHQEVTEAGQLDKHGASSKNILPDAKCASFEEAMKHFRMEERNSRTGLMIHPLMMVAFFSATTELSWNCCMYTFTSKYLLQRLTVECTWRPNRSTQIKRKRTWLLLTKYSAGLFRFFPPPPSGLFPPPPGRSCSCCYQCTCIYSLNTSFASE